MTNITEKIFVQFVSDEAYYIFELVNFFTLSSVIGSFGVVSNVMNIIIFYKQGFDNTMNISFFGLAISDLCNLITMIWFNICMSPLLVDNGVPIARPEVQYLTAGLPHICFARITSWITVYITAERTLCITLPLKIRQLITPRRTTIILSTIYILIFVSFEPEYETTYFGWRFDVEENRTLFGLLFRSNRKDVEGITFIMYAMLGFISFLMVIVFTLVLIIQLNKKSRWRKKATFESGRSETISSRERKTMMMVIMIAVVLIVCYTPGVGVSATTFFEPEVSVTGKDANVFFTCWSFAFVFDALNSSVNILLYYNMSTKYRETFRMVFGCWTLNDTTS